MRIISMSDFVLEQNGVLETYINHLRRPLFERCVRYANFLKQPLKLEMFVPCDKQGVIIDVDSRYTSDYEHLNKELDKRYEKAKEKVLFEGCSTIQQGENTIVMFDGSAIWITWTNRIVEDLLKNRVILTPNAIKQFM